MTAHEPIERGDGESLEMWVLYDHPRDAPDSYVARLFLISKAGAQSTDRTMTEQCLETLRKYMRAAGLHCLARQVEDDPVIIESWL